MKCFDGGTIAMLEQIGPPAEVYRRPASAFVARFVGTVNAIVRRVVPGGVETAAGFIAVPVAGLVAGAAANVLVRAEAVRIEVLGTDGLAAAVMSLSFRGATTRVSLDLRGGVPLVADVAGTAAEHLSAGGDVAVRFDPSGVLVEPA